MPRPQSSHLLNVPDALVDLRFLLERGLLG